MLLHLLIPLGSWSVVNVSADINDFCLISLDTSLVSREELCLPCFDVVNCLVVDNLLWGRSLRVAKCYGFVLSPWQ